MLHALSLRNISAIIVVDTAHISNSSILGIRTSELAYDFDTIKLAQYRYCPHLNHELITTQLT